MRDPRYGLGIDVGDRTVVAAVRSAVGTDPIAEPVLLGGTTVAVPAAAALDAVGRLGLAPPRPGAGPADLPGVHVLSRIGAATPLYVGGRPVAAADALAAMVADVIATVTDQQGRAPAGTVLTVPPSWGGHRRTQLTAALVARGLPDVLFVSSAVATARQHAGDDRLPAGATVAVHDIGASTIDTAVVRLTRDGSGDQLGTPPAPVAWGGRDIDDALLRHVCSTLAVRPAGPRTTPDARARLAATLQACVAAKEALSTAEAVRLAVDLPPTAPDTVLPLTRADVESLVAAPVEASVTALRRAIAGAGLSVEDVDVVLLAGGTAAMPLVARTLAAALDLPVLAGPRPELSAALGAAQMAWEHAEGAAAADDEQLDDEQPDAGTAPERRPAAHRVPWAAGQARPRRGPVRPAPARPAPARVAREAGASPAPRPPARDRHRQTQRIAVVVALVAVVLGLGSLVTMDSGTRSALQESVLGTDAELPRLLQPPLQLGDGPDPASEEVDPGTGPGARTPAARTSGSTGTPAENTGSPAANDSSPAPDAPGEPAGAENTDAGAAPGDGAPAAAEAGAQGAGAEGAGGSTGPTPTDPAPATAPPTTEPPTTTSPTTAAPTTDPPNTEPPSTTAPPTTEPTTTTDPPADPPPPTTEPPPVPTTDPGDGEPAPPAAASPVPGAGEPVAG